MVKSVLSHHLYDEAVTVEGVGESPLLLSNDLLLSFMKYDINNELKKMTIQHKNICHEDKWKQAIGLNDCQHVDSQ